MYQQLTELHRYLLAIQNSPVSGKSALKAVQLRLDQNSSDPIFATRQMAKTLPAPLNRWVGKLADQAWHVVMVEAVHYMEVDWRDNVVNPFTNSLPTTIHLIHAPHRMPHWMRLNVSLNRMAFWTISIKTTCDCSLKTI